MKDIPENPGNIILNSILTFSVVNTNSRNS
jgi:hypothetical protein